MWGSVSFATFYFFSLLLSYFLPFLYINGCVKVNLFEQFWLIRSIVVHNFFVPFVCCNFGVINGLLFWGDPSLTFFCPIGRFVARVRLLFWLNISRLWFCIDWLFDYTVSILTARVYGKEWLHVLQSAAIAWSNDVPELISSGTEILCGNKLGREARRVCLRYFHAFFDFWVVWLVYFYISPTDLQLLVILAATEHESICEPSDTDFCAWIDNCVVFADGFVRSIAAQVVNSIISTRINSHHDLDILWVWKIDVIVPRWVNCVKVGCSFFIRVKVCTR